MTATDPQRLDAALDYVLHAWHTETGQRPPSALLCADAHPFAPEVLCRRLDGHSGTHSSDGADAWADADEPTTPGRTA